MVLDQPQKLQASANYRSEAWLHANDFVKSTEYWKKFFKTFFGKGNLHFYSLCDMDPPKSPSRKKRSCKNERYHPAVYLNAFFKHQISLFFSFTLQTKRGEPAQRTLQLR